MNLRFLIVTTLLLTVVWSKTDAAISVSLTVDSNNPQMGESCELVVTISGATSLTGYPRIENLDGFDIQNGGTGTQMQIINGVVSSQKSFTFYLMAKKTGKQYIGPAIVQYNGVDYKSNRIEMNVGAGGGRPQNQNNYQQQQQQQDPDNDAPPETISGSGDGSRPYRVEVTYSKKNPWQGEQVTYTFRFIRSAEVLKAQWEPPTFNGLLKEELGQPRVYEKVVNGREYQINEVNLALFPVKSGSIELPNTTLDAAVLSGGGSRAGLSLFGFGSIMMGGQQKRVRLTDGATTFNVKELPHYSSTTPFSGAVGHFNLKSTISKREAKVGESVTLTVDIAGDGLFKGVNLKAPNFRDFQVYEDKPQFDRSVNDGKRLQNSAKLSWALVCQKEGDVTIPSYQFVYFDPTAGEYKTIQTESYSIHVLPGSKEVGGEMVSGAPLSQAVAKQEIRQDGYDVRPLKVVPLSESGDVWVKWILSLSLFLYLGSAFIWVKRYFEGRQTSVDGASKKDRAFNKLKKSLDRISSSKYVEEISLSLKEYIGERLMSDSGRGLTGDEISKLLKERSIDQNVLEQTLNFFKLCDEYLYAGINSSPLTQSKERLSQEALSVAQKIKREIR